MDAEIVLCFTDNGEIDFAVVKASDANDFGTERLIALTDKKHSVKCGDIRTFKGEIICKRTAKEIITIVNDYYGIRHGDDFEYKKRFDEIVSIFTYDFVCGLGMKYYEDIVNNDYLTFEDIVVIPGRTIVLCDSNKDEIEFAIIITDKITEFGEERTIILQTHNHKIRCGNIDEFKCEIVSRNSAKEIITAVEQHYGFGNYYHRKINYVIDQYGCCGDVLEIKKEFDKIVKLYGWRFIFEFWCKYNEKFAEFNPKLEDILIANVKKIQQPLHTK